MKKLLLCFLVSASLIACTNQETKTETAEQKSTTVEHIFKPTYTDNFKIGGEGNVLLVEKFHQAIFAKDFKQMGEFLADTAIFNLDDGTVINGKDSMVKYAEKNFSKLNIINYNQLVSLPVVADNGHEWVLVWDEADLEVDGKSTKVLWQDAYRVSNGKIVVMNGFAKYPK
jgi:hypothetical protein